MMLEPRVRVPGLLKSYSLFCSQKEMRVRKKGSCKSGSLTGEYLTSFKSHVPLRKASQSPATPTPKPWHWKP
uniref:Putative ovule protein n=1 Tax=Solanum chacoense TaxID=4108 RepID=A0A0V0H314_SOLCH